MLSGHLIPLPLKTTGAVEVPLFLAISIFYREYDTHTTSFSWEVYDSAATPTVTFEWGDGTADTVETGTTGTTNHNYSLAGTYNIVVTVFDGSASYSVNYVEVISAGMTQFEGRVDSNGLDARLHLYLATEIGSTGISVDWGDGNTRPSEVFNTIPSWEIHGFDHTYAAAGTYEVVVTAINQVDTTQIEQLRLSTVLRTDMRILSPVDGGTLTDVSTTRVTWTQAYRDDLDHWRVVVTDRTTNEVYFDVIRPKSLFPTSDNFVTLSGLPEDGELLEIAVYGRDSSEAVIVQDAVDVTAYALPTSAYLYTPTDGQVLEASYFYGTWKHNNESNVKSWNVIAKVGATTVASDTGIGEQYSSYYLSGLPVNAETLTFSLEKTQESDDQVVVLDTITVTAHTTSLASPSITIPTEGQVLPGESPATLTWDADGDTDVYAWKAVITKQSTGTIVMSKTLAPQITSTSILDLDANESYVLQLSKFRDVVGHPEVLLDSINFTTGSTETVAQITSPGPGTVSGGTQLVQWDLNDDTDADSWDVHGLIDSGSVFESVTPGSSTSVILTGLPTAQGETIDFQLTKVNSSGNHIRDLVSTVVNPPATGDPLVSQGATRTYLTSGQILVVSGKKFENITGQRALWIDGDSTNEVLIEDCLFSSCDHSIRTEGVGKVTVKNCRFEDVGYCTRIDNATDVEVTFNEARGVGILDSADVEAGIWSNNFVQVVGSSCTRLVIEDNVVDNSGDTRPNISSNIHREDYIAIFHSTYVGSGRGSIRRNHLRGAESTCESSSAGGIVFDQLSSNYEVEDNIVVNTGQYCYGNANSGNNLFKGNKGFMSYTHDYNLLSHPNNPTPSPPGPEAAVGVINSAYGSGTPGHVTWENNQVVAERSNSSGTALFYHYNWWQVTQNTFTNNNFDGSSATGGPLSNPNASILPADMFSGLTDNGYMTVRRPTEVT